MVAQKAQVSPSCCVLMIAVCFRGDARDKTAGDGDGGKLTSRGSIPRDKRVIFLGKRARHGKNEQSRARDLKKLKNMTGWSRLSISFDSSQGERREMRRRPRCRRVVSRSPQF